MFSMNKLPAAKRVAVIRSLIEGNSIRSTVRMTGAAKNTVLKLLAEVGAACSEYQDKALVNLPCREIQCDEIWSFIGKKEKRLKPQERGTGRKGDCWTWTALCAQTKLIPCWHVGRRDVVAARAFVEDLASRLAHRVQLTTDGHRPYLKAVEIAFGWNGVDYAVLDKLYSHPTGAPEAARRYSPSEVVGTEKTWVMGNPDMKKVSTSLVESHNLTMRMRNRRLTRLTNGYSKKLENHMHAMSLYMMAYNFVHVHHTLTKARNGIHTTPAMAAGVADHVWKVEEIVALLG